MKIIISGAGIAGMSSALALAKIGYKVTLYEKVTQLAEVGAGLQLAPNATRILSELGVLDAVQTLGVQPETIMMKDGSNDRLLTELPVKNIALNRWKSPYVTIHRATLQKILYQEILKTPLIELRLASEVVNYRGSIENGYEITIRQSQNIKSDRCDLFIISDGVWSNLREKHLREISKFSGYISWRATLPFDELPQSFIAEDNLPSISVYMHNNSHFIIYPAKKGELYNFVAITNGKISTKNWSTQGEKIELLKAFAGWHTNINNIIQKAENWTFWPLFQMPTPRFIGLSDEIFIGDSSHAVTPFAAQGAAMAIEDAATLSSALKQAGSLKKKILLYEKNRKIRIAQVAKRGDFNRFVYHASGPIALARNTFMKMRTSEKFLTDLDWLYNYNAYNIDS